MEQFSVRSRKYTGVPISSPNTGTPSSGISILHHSGPLLMISEPILTHQHLFKSILYSSGPQPFWHQGLVSWLTFFSRTEGGRNGSGDCVMMGSSRWGFTCSLGWHSPPGVAQFLTGHGLAPVLSPGVGEPCFMGFILVFGHSLGLGKCIMTFIHQCRVLQNNFTALKILCAPPVHPSLLCNHRQWLNAFTVSIDLPLQKVI